MAHAYVREEKVLYGDLLVWVPIPAVAANEFPFWMSYGTLLCVSDKPFHGELNLPGMATEFYKSKVSRHLIIGVKAMESLQNVPLEWLHSRKLLGFDRSAFV